MQMIQFACAGWTAALLAVVAGSVAAAPSGGLTLEVVVDEGVPVLIKPIGAPVPDPDALQYTGTAQFEGTSFGWQLIGAGSATVATTPKLSGSVNITNNGAGPRDYIVTVRQPGLTACKSENVFGGSAFATLLLDPAGGAVTGPVDGPMWTALIDGHPVQGLFQSLAIESASWGAFLAGPEGFGDPIPSDPSDGVSESIGLQYRFTLSAGDMFSIASVFVVAFIDLDCFQAADLNADGVVDGSDLGLLLQAWGTADRIADLNGDGVVDGSDLGLLLQAWSGR